MRRRPRKDSPATLDMRNGLTSSPPEVFTISPAADCWEAIESLAARLPAPETLPAKRWIAISTKEARRSWLSRIGFARPKGTGDQLAIACTALLRRGYQDIHLAANGLACGRPPSARQR